MFIEAAKMRDLWRLCITPWGFFYEGGHLSNEKTHWPALDLEPLPNVFPLSGR